MGGKDRHWYLFNDSAVTRVSESEVVSKASYILFYERVADASEVIEDAPIGEARSTSTLKEPAQPADVDTHRDVELPVSQKVSHGRSEVSGKYTPAKNFNSGV